MTAAKIKPAAKPVHMVLVIIVVSIKWNTAINI